MDKKMQALIDAPLADPKSIFLPEGRRKATRAARPQYHDEVGVPKLSGREVAERKQRAASKKLTALYDYYASTDLSFERIAQHMGIYRQEQRGVDDKGKPILVRVLDTKTVGEQISWRRASSQSPYSERGGE